MNFNSLKIAKFFLFIILFSCNSYAQINEFEVIEDEHIRKDYNSQILDSYSNSEVKLNNEYKDFLDLSGRAVNDYSKEAPSIFSPKKPTPERFFKADLSVPIKFGHTNNLAKKAGAFYRAFGEIIFIQGKVTDSFNVPISGAVIEIWQKNAAGKYHSLLEPDSEYIDKYFSMSGRAITDNLGNYHFITIMPGSNPGRAPHINMNIYHQKFGKLETEMYFQDHPYNENDYQYLVYSKEERPLVTALVRHSNILNTKSIKICTFSIVMEGVHKYKKF
jgi:protocatechuate 3,4-dioxygenase beta subunit